MTLNQSSPKLRVSACSPYCQCWLPPVLHAPVCCALKCAVYAAYPALKLRQWVTGRRMSPQSMECDGMQTEHAVAVPHCTGWRNMMQGVNNTNMQAEGCRFIGCSGSGGAGLRSGAVALLAVALQACAHNLGVQRHETDKQVLSAQATLLLMALSCANTGAAQQSAAGQPRCCPVAGLSPALLLQTCFSPTT